MPWDRLALRRGKPLHVCGEGSRGKTQRARGPGGPGPMRVQDESAIDAVLAALEDHDKFVRSAATTALPRALGRQAAEQCPR